MQLQDFASALAAFDRAIMLNEKDAWALSQRGVVYEKLKRYVDAEQDYRAAIALEPENSITHGNLAGAYIAMGRYAEAKKELGERIRLAQENTFHPLVLLGQIERLMGDKGSEAHCLEALGNWETAVAAGWQTQAALLSDKAMALLFLQRKDEAVDTLREALASSRLGADWDTEELEQLKNAPEPPEGLDEMIALIRSVKPAD